MLWTRKDVLELSAWVFTAGIGLGMLVADIILLIHRKKKPNLYK